MKSQSDIKLTSSFFSSPLKLAMLDLHENKIEEAKQHAKKALEISKTFESTNHRYLLSKLKYVQSALARRGGNYAEAKELLDDSVEVRTN